MRFNLKEKSGYLPELSHENIGKELECFIPTEYDWVQVNYGQGEGQVVIKDCEWGFYYTEDSISIILHKGSIDLESACVFVEKVNKKIFVDKACTVKISLVGVE